jgi:hypothetical protein
MGVARDTGKKYLSIPAAGSYFNSLCQELREGETPRNIWTAITIREDPEMAKTAAGNKVRLEAIRSIAQRDGPANVNVNLGIGVGVEITAGYQVTIPDDYAKAADKILAASGSTQRLGSDGNVIDVPNPRLPAPANPSP